MDTDAKGQLGGIECSKEARERLARESGAYKCAGCGRSNADIMKEREEMLKDIEEKEGQRKEEEVPEELRLAYRDELGKQEDKDEPKMDKGKGRATEPAAEHSTSTITSAASSSSAPPVRTPATPRVPALPTRTQPPHVQQVIRHSPDRSLAWIDTCIYGVVAALLFMVVKKFL